MISYVGVDPLVDVEKLGKQLGFTMDNKNFHSVSLGQGQEVVAEAALDTAAEHGHWVILQVCVPFSLHFHVCKQLYFIIEFYSSSLSQSIGASY